MTVLTQSRSFSRNAVMVLGGSIVLALSAQLFIPLLPVPVTLQTMIILLMAVFLGPGLTFLAAVAYLAEGAVGLPVFADFVGGIHVLLGYTAGYLFALPVAGFIAGYIAQKRSFIGILLAGLVSTLIILSLGTLALSHFFGMRVAFDFGFKPFILIEIIKVLAVAGGVVLSNRLLKKSH